MSRAGGGGGGWVDWWMVVVDGDGGWLVAVWHGVDDSTCYSLSLSQAHCQERIAGAAPSQGLASDANIRNDGCNDNDWSRGYTGRIRIHERQDSKGTIK